MNAPSWCDDPRIRALFFARGVCLCGLLIASMGLPAGAGESQTLQVDEVHLRLGDTEEWRDFSAVPAKPSLSLSFESSRNAEAWTLAVQQWEVKEKWVLGLNGKKLGQLRQDENNLIQYVEVPAGILMEGANTLTFEPDPAARGKVDDIGIGQVVLHQEPPPRWLGEGAMAVTVQEDGHPVPCLITIVDAHSALAALGTTTGSGLAVRPGVVYAATGEARISLPAGDYTVYAGRGFEYSLDRVTVSVGAGKMASVDLSIQREVPTEGYVACDPHIHTVTHSGHGDCTVEERMVTLAGEGIELPIATDHNVHIDYEATARAMGVRPYFTPVIGNEVTTSLGHFNVFPVKADAPLPDANATSWDDLFASIKGTPNVRAIILNHARDLHAGMRPFGPEHYDDVTGANTDGWDLQANAMEIINSGATQSDLLELTRDWMTQLNHGVYMTPVGSSDSHDVNRFIVGQGRTYVRCADDEPGNINIDEAVKAFVAGNVLVSYGLVVEMSVNERYRSGELAAMEAGATSVEVALRVLGPHWVEASEIQLYANGARIRELKISREQASPVGVIWTGRWTIDVPKHDVHLVAIATGPGIDAPYWKMARPYQPTSPEYSSQVFGCSGAVWVDGDGDGKRSSARDYAERLVKTGSIDLENLEQLRSAYDAAVAIQARYLLSR